MSHSDEDWQRFKEKLVNQREQVNEEAVASQREANQEFEQFIYHAEKGECYACGKSLKTFSANSPCPHWLLRPKGVKKHHILEVLKRDGYHRSAAFLRWFANFQARSRNINDLLAEGDTKAVFHWSCCFEHRKWSFKCAEGDMKGHEGTKHGCDPHYHIEIRLNGNIFVKFNDFHVPFTDEDMFWFKANSDDEFPVKQGFGIHGSGMQDAMNIEPEELIKNMRKGTENEEADAVYQVDSFIFSDEGISGDVVADAIDASKESGKTIAYHLEQANLEPKVVISPANTVPEKSERTNPRKKI